MFIFHTNIVSKACIIQDGGDQNHQSLYNPVALTTDLRSKEDVRLSFLFFSLTQTSHSQTALHEGQCHSESFSMES